MPADATLEAGPVDTVDEMMRQKMIGLLGLCGVLWMIWPGSEAAAAPLPFISMDHDGGGVFEPTALDQVATGSGEIAREPLPERAPRQIQVLDARTMEPIEGASVFLQGLSISRIPISMPLPTEIGRRLGKPLDPGFGNLDDDSLRLLIRPGSEWSRGSLLSDASGMVA